MATQSKTGITIDDAMRGFTNGNLDALRDMSPEDIWTTYRDSGVPGEDEPFFTVDELARWLEQEGLR